MIDQVIHVLSIEDNPAEAMLIQKQLAEAQRVGWDLPRFAVEHVDCLETALARLDGGGEFDVVLSDLDLPDSQAGETVATLREHIPHMPLVVLTGREDEVLAHQSIRAGVQDYLYKNEATGSLLARALMYASERQQMHAALEQRVEERTVELRQANEELHAEIAERKEAEVALQESETRFRTLFETTTEGIVLHEVVYDEAGTAVNYRILDANPAFEQHTSIPVAAIRGKLAPEAYGTAEPPYLSRYAEVAVTGKPTAFETYFPPMQRHFYITAFSPARGQFATLFRDITARKRAEERIRFLSDITEKIDDSLIVTDAHFAITYLNQAAERLFGYTLDEVRGKTPEFLNAEPMADQIQRELYATVSSGKTYTAEAINMRKDGSTFVCEFKVMPLKDEQGRIVSYVGVQRDITARQQAEEALRETTQRFQALLDHSPALVHIFDEEGRYLLVGEATAAALGLPREEIIGKTFADLLPPETVATFMRRVERLKEDRAVLSVEDQILVKGEERFFESLLFPLSDEAGMATYTAIATDVTERKRAEEALRRERDLLARITETSPVSITIVDCDGQITFANKRAENVLGLTKEQITQRAYNEPAWRITDYDGNPFPAAELPFKQVMDTGQAVYDVRHAIEWPNGRRVLLSINAAPLFDDTHQLNGMVAALEDVTRRIQAEERVKHLNLVLRTISNVNQLIIKETDRGRLMQGVCDKLTETRGYHNAWIALLDDARGSVTAFESGLGADFAALCAQLQRGELNACGQQALSQSEVVVTEDPASTCTDCPLAASYAGRGAMTVRLEHDGDVYGLLTVSVPAHFTMDEEEHSLLQEVAGDIAFALHSSELEEKRKQAEEALQRSEARYQTLVEGAEETIATVNEDGVFLFMNSAAAQQLGGEPEDFIGQTMWDLFPPEDADVQVSNIQRVIQTEERMTVEAPTILQGNERWYRTSIQPIHDPDDEVGVALLIARDITARKRAEEALWESEMRFRQIYEHIAVGIAQVSLDYIIEHANQAYCQMLGYSEEELIGKHLKDITHSETVEANLRRQAQLARGEMDHYQLEKKFIHKQGHTVYGILNANLIRGTDDTPNYFIGSVLDITARKQAEVALRANEKLFRTLFDNVKDAIFVHPILPDNQPGPFIQVNAAACAMLSYSPTEFSRMTLWELDDPTTSNDYIPQAMQQLRDRGSARFEAYQVAKDGRKVLVEVHANVCEIHGTPHIISVARDVTARKRAEHATQARLRLTQAAAAHTPEALMRSTLDEIEALTNSEISFYHLLLPDQQTIVHQAWSTHTLAQCTAATPGRRELVSAGGVWAECLTTRAPVVHNDYAPFPQHRGLPAGHAPVTRVVVVPVMRAERVVAILGVGNKPTAYQATDVELIALLADFSWEIIERRRTEVELAHYAAELQRSNADLQQFATIVSHDLQTPLRQVTGFLGLLEKQYRASLDAEAREYIDFAVTNARHMSSLIHDLLQYARLDSRGQEPAPLDTAALLAAVLRTLQLQIADCGAELTHDPLPLVHADATQAQQLFQNLLGNALKFRRPDVPPRIHIAVERQGEQWQFAIRDNGIGIAPQYHEHIFTIFQRGAMTNDDEYAGTGVGLAICQKIVARHGGRIWLESAEGQGATFYFTLPAVPSAQP